MPSPGVPCYTDTPPRSPWRPPKDTHTAPELAPGAQLLNENDFFICLGPLIYALTKLADLSSLEYMGARAPRSTLAPYAHLPLPLTRVHSVGPLD